MRLLFGWRFVRINEYIFEVRVHLYFEPAIFDRIYEFFLVELERTHHSLSVPEFYV